jgi:DNA-binding HxlR family transcriptional regulator
MAKKHRYGDGCVVASALDVIGERWALLVVRELLLGPKRYTDLQRGLNGPSSNVLSQRLHDLEAHGVVRRRRLGPPASSWVYELTAWGLGLEPVLVHLGRWGRDSPFHDCEAETSVDSLLLAMRVHFDPAAGARVDDTYALHVGDDRFSVRVGEHGLTVARGGVHQADAVIRTDSRTLQALLTERLAPDEAVAGGRLAVTGDAAAATRLFRSVTRSQPGPGPAPTAA